MPTINRIVIPLYPDFDILDVCGPFAMFASAASEFNASLVLAAAEEVLGKHGLVKSWQGASLHTTTRLESLTLASADLLWVPGGYGPGFNSQISADSPLTSWLKAKGSHAGYVCSVCTGALPLAAAGLLDGYTVTTHWMFQQALAMFPGVRLASGYPRYWIDRNRITGGGVSSGLDESLAAIAAIWGSTAAMHVQLGNQYAPEPPYNAGSPLTAPPDVLASLMQGDKSISNVETAVAQFLKGQS